MRNTRVLSNRCWSRPQPLSTAEIRASVSGGLSWESPTDRTDCGRSGTVAPDQDTSGAHSVCQG